MITSDQQHWNTIGAFNHEISTPNLDRLAEEGTTFSRAYCPNPTCTPSRASIITGMYPSQHGAWAIGTKLSEDVQTIGHVLNDNGYQSALIGKAHFQPLKSDETYTSLESYPILQDLEFWRTFNGPFYGFDHIELARNHTNEAHVGQHYALWLEEKGCKNWRDYFLSPIGSMDRSTRYKWAIPEEYHYNTWIAERSNAKLEEYKDNDASFFLWASFFDPHPPYLVPEPWDTMYDPEKLTVPKVVAGEHDQNPPHFKLTQESKPDFSSYIEGNIGNIGFHSHIHVSPEEAKQNMAVYYGMISMIDKYIGSILDKLDDLGLADNTIVVFTSDHGHFFGQHGLHDKGGFHYEDLLKLPFIVRYPGHVPQGDTCSSMQSLVDLAPTFLSFLGITIPREMTGVNQKEVWLGNKEMERNHVICEYRSQPTKVHQKTFVGERYKITVYFNETFGELFDLQEDPQEIRNLWNDSDYREIKEQLLFQYIWAELGKEPLWMPRITGA